MLSMCRPTDMILTTFLPIFADFSFRLFRFLESIPGRLAAYDTEFSRFFVKSSIDAGRQPDKSWVDYRRNPELVQFELATISQKPRTKGYRNSCAANPGKMDFTMTRLGSYQRISFDTTFSQVRVAVNSGT